MLSDVLARVDALSTKGDELAEKGHVLRAAENFARAATAARSLGDDNLVLLHMQLRQELMLGCYITNVPDTHADRRILAAHRAESIALLCGAVAALERRRVAGTLAEGKCTAAEEAWYTHEVQRGLAADEEPIFCWAPLFGYDVFLNAAASAAGVLACIALYERGECSDTQLQSFADCIVHAVELMQLPRRNDDVIIGTESRFTCRLREVVARASAGELNARVTRLLADALQRLERSGVLETRLIDEFIAAAEPEQCARHVTMQKSLTAPGLRTCALPGCGTKEAHPAHFKSCAACRAVVYCCREHQVEGWPGHKKTCKAARKAAGAAEDGGAGPSGA